MKQISTAVGLWHEMNTQADIWLLARGGGLVRVPKW